VANRADRAVAWLGGGGYIKADFSRGRGRGPCCSYGYFYHEDVEYSATIYAPNLVDGQYRGFFWRDRDLVKLQRVYDNGAYIMLDLREWVEESPGPVSIGPPHRAFLASDGHLFVDSNPLSSALAVNELTGEALDLSTMREVGQLDYGSAGHIRVDCDDICATMLDGLEPRRASDGVAEHLLRAPVAGILRCIPHERPTGDVLAYELDAGDFRLQIFSLGATYGQKWTGGCEPKQVFAGDEIPVWPHTDLHATSPDGSPISVVATQDGRLFVGETRFWFGCPCEPRS
jgi:hypothetical protein